MKIQDQLNYKRHSDDDNIDRRLKSGLKKLEQPCFVRVVQKTEMGELTGLELLRLFENKYRTAHNSFGMVLNKDGEMLETVMGNPTMVRFRDETVEKALGGTISHIHTSNVTFSFSDVLMAIANNIRELRAVVDTGTYVIYFSPHFVNSGQVTTQERLKRITQDYTKMWLNFYNFSKKIKWENSYDQMNYILTKIWQTLSRLYNFTYTFEDKL